MCCFCHWCDLLHFFVPPLPYCLPNQGRNCSSPDYSTGCLFTREKARQSFRNWAWIQAAHKSKWAIDSSVAVCAFVWFNRRVGGFRLNIKTFLVEVALFFLFVGSWHGTEHISPLGHRQHRGKHLTHARYSCLCPFATVWSHDWLLFLCWTSWLTIGRLTIPILLFVFVTVNELIDRKCYWSGQIGLPTLFFVANQQYHH